ncbi:unnamed protein product [Orchesella dallaii]|uniref:Exonuclease domain-containing protein n=1 Tax=Orchesella dallaii TaxID=48710 RepID=A0ABP1S377_9HEXA
MESEDIDRAKKLVINWIGQAEWKEKYAFMASMLGQLPESEVKTVQNLTSKTRKEMKRKRYEAHVQSKRSRVESAPVESVPPGLPNGWWAKYQLTDILAFDCEHVHYRKLKGRERVKAGSVSVVDYKGDQIYYAEIKHERGSFLVNNYTRKVNGFNENSLVNGKDLEVVMAEVGALFEGKLIITYGGGTDFDSLELFSGDFDTYDIAEYFKKPKPNKRGEDYGEKIGLRTLCHHFFHEDIQAGVHSPKTDAAATMKLFLEVYVKSNLGSMDRHFTNYNLFQDILAFKG